MDPKYIPQTHATSTGSTFINYAITPSQKLRELTFEVVLGHEARGLTARVYRKSLSAPGLQSCDIYDWIEGDCCWKYWGKDDAKYTEAPPEPPGAIESSIEGFAVRTMNALTEVEKGRLKTLIFVLKTSGDAKQQS